MRPRSEADGHYQNYNEYSKTLRAWLVAYGVGGPVLFLTNEAIYTRVAASAHAFAIVALFFLSVGSQILLSVVNKWAAWNMYRGAFEDAYVATERYRLWRKVNECSTIDFLIDVASLIFLVWATLLVLSVFLLSGVKQ